MTKQIKILTAIAAFILSLVVWWVQTSSHSKLNYSQRIEDQDAQEPLKVEVPDTASYKVSEKEIEKVKEWTPARFKFKAQTGTNAIVSGRLVGTGHHTAPTYLKVVVTDRNHNYFDKHRSVDVFNVKFETSSDGKFVGTYSKEINLPREVGRYRIYLIEAVKGKSTKDKGAFVFAVGDFETFEPEK